MTTKIKLLLYLKAHKGQWVSGEVISNELDVSRSAIWKHIGKLRDAGYLIESSPKKGYLLEAVSDALNPDEIRDGLSTKYIGRGEIHCLQKADSTNIRAKFLAEAGAAEGTLVTAESQTKGKGRKGRDWHSVERAGLYFSLILRPAMPPGEAPKITLMTAVALAEALIETSGMDAKIKWPNDILIKGRKLAGILTEISTDIEAVNYVIVGIGINVNHEEGHFPKALAAIATSAKIEAGRHFSRAEILQSFLNKYEQYYEVLTSNGFDPIITRWKGLSDIIGMRVKVDVINKCHIGQVIDVDRDGVLILKDDHNQTHRIFSGDVTRLRPKGSEINNLAFYPSQI